MENEAALAVSTPVGRLSLFADQDRLRRIDWANTGASDAPVLALAAEQIAQYFEGSRETFELPLALPDDPSKSAFLNALMDIPFGQTRTYGELAKDLGVSAQAIGQACGANPLPIVIPCHRVLAHNGLGGYSGANGIETKVALLRHEGAAGLLI